MVSSLSPDKEDQVYVTVRPIVAGTAFLPFVVVFEDSKDVPKEEGCRVPVICFLITHPTKGHALFDLGIRKESQHGRGYPPHLDEMIFGVFRAECEQDIAESLVEGGVKLEDVRNVILSHLHWDHVGDASAFTSADIVLGAEATTPLADEVYPKNPTGTINELPEGRNVVFIDYTPSSHLVVAPFGPFERAVDFYGDGSLYIVNTPGHFPGHISAVARVAPDTFVFLAGDLCHHRQCYTPCMRLSGRHSHRDVPTARETTQQLASLNTDFDNVIVILAHEAERLEEGMPLFPNDVRGWVLEQVETRKAARKIS